MPATDQIRNSGIDPDAPEFAGIRADLARLYMKHRAHLGITLASDEWILTHVNDLTGALYFLSLHARDHDDAAWLRRHRWWLRATQRLFNGEPATALDG